MSCKMAERILILGNSFFLKKLCIYFWQNSRLLNKAGYGCSFVAKLIEKKIVFALKKYMFFTKYTLFAEKMFLYGKNSFILKNFFTGKNFFCREKYKWKCKNIYLIWEIYFYAENVCVTNKI